MSNCRQVLTLLDAYADGELEPDEVLEIEAHLADCEACVKRLELEHAVKKSLRRAVSAASQPSDAFKDRVLASFQAEAERQAVGKLESSRRGSPLSWGQIVPLAAAAAIALLWSAGGNNAPGTSPSASNVQFSNMEPFNVQQALDELIDRHIDRSTPEVTEPSLLGGMEPEVGVPVRFASLTQYGARWEGGKLVPLTQNAAALRTQNTASLRAASLRYLVDGHRVTLYVYNSERFPIDSALKRRVVRNEPVYTGWKRGYSIAATDRHGVGYALATDLGEDEGAEMVASLH